MLARLNSEAARGLSTSSGPAALRAVLDQGCQPFAFDCGHYGGATVLVGALLHPREHAPKVIVERVVDVAVTGGESKDGTP